MAASRSSSCCTASRASTSAPPLLDPEQPLAMRCGRDQARSLIVWHNHLPACGQVSFSCERLGHGANPNERR